MTTYKYDEGIVTLTIEDNGHDNETAQVKNGHGLENMKWRAEQLSADLNIVSDTEQGYTLLLALPVSSSIASI